MLCLSSGYAYHFVKYTLALFSLLLTENSISLKKKIEIIVSFCVICKRLFKTEIFSSI